MIVEEIERVAVVAVLAAGFIASEVDRAPAVVVTQDRAEVVSVSQESSVQTTIERPLILVAGGNQGPQGIQGAKGDQGEPGPPGAGSSVQDNFTATPQVLADRFVTLSAPPADPLKVELVIYGGPEQQPAVDFIVTGNVLSWEGLALELLLEQGSFFSVRYIT